jgi:hypothetical protein
MKNSNDTIGNRSCYLPVCSAVLQPLRHEQRAPSYTFSDSRNRILIFTTIYEKKFPLPHYCGSGDLAIVALADSYRSLH